MSLLSALRKTMTPFVRRNVNPTTIIARMGEGSCFSYSRGGIS